MDRGAWWATVYGVAKSRMRLSDLARMPTDPVCLWLCLFSLHLRPFMPAVNTDLVQCNTGSWLSRAGCRAPSSPCTVRMLSKQKGLAWWALETPHPVPGRFLAGIAAWWLPGSASSGEEHGQVTTPWLLPPSTSWSSWPQFRNAWGRLLRGASVASHQDEHLFFPLYMRTIILSALSLTHWWRMIFSIVISTMHRSLRWSKNRASGLS